MVNLASKEYSRSVERYLKDDIQYVTCVFGELTDGRVKTKGTLAKDGQRRDGALDGQ